MKHPRVLLTTAVLIPALLALALPETKIAFTVEEGATTTKTYTSEVELSLDNMEMTMNGEEPPMMPEIDMSVTTKLEISVSDEYVAMGDGQPKKLKRSYDSLDLHTDMAMEIDMMGNTQTQEMPLDYASELEGKTVLFSWSEDEGEFVPSFPEEEGESELLEGLSEDMDLRGFLPEDSVSEGDEWEIAPASLAFILAPGGNLKLLPDDVDLEDLMGMNPNMGSMNDWFTEDIEGEVTATFTGVREVEGVKVGAITLQIDISNAVDLTEMIEAAMEEMELPPEAGDIEFDHVDMEIELEGEGTLLWNLASGHAHSFELSGDFAMLMNMGMAVSAQGMDMEFEQTFEMSGTMNQDATVE